MTKICICGGGSLAHVCASVLSSRPKVVVNLFTRKPKLWAHQLEVNDFNGNGYNGKLNIISNNPEEVLRDCDIVLLCLPGFAIESTLQSIRPFVGKAVIGSIVCSTGFFFAAHRVFGENGRFFGFQRVPYIARTVEYGHTAKLLGYKPQLAIAVENVENREVFRQLVETLWMIPTKLLASYYEVSLTNSNPILHTGRLYSMWKDWNDEVYNHNILFYKEWTNEASQVLIDMDAEFMQLLDVLSVTKGAILPLLEYYESHDAESLTKKIASIHAFQDITSPMKKVDGGWIPDFDNRYFTEDFPFGLKYIWQLAHEKGISCPNIDMVYEWGMSKIK